jgi:large subunit ribosomal protein L35
MPKMKTHSGAKARIKITGTGKLRREQQMRRHMLEHKSSARKRRLDGEVDLHPSDVRRIKRLLGK